ncbi:hypothetical protein psal_cds_1327 [Pandoravirus salinus]|uniref:Uncharacterized protein n=1 Tax=Pandoravirus salinus TaxID=1349410 RepID=S4W5Q5_9VIRU|nr:hypothetical protein psal_cds_1327 [Pandoravirus salinus]AGO85710.1 hypothetical protein psal_cds_1327 [Pandoravirus salinus]
MTSDSINDFFCNDLLYIVLVECAGARCWPILARVCARWRGVIAAAPRSGSDVFIEMTASECAATGAASVRLLFGWATRTRALVAQVGPSLLHVGHLISATVQGQCDLVRWIRTQQRHAPKECPTRRRLESQWIEGDDDYFFCPRCGSGCEADVWPWVCAARLGRTSAILDDVDVLLDERPWTIVRDTWCRWQSAIARVLTDIVRHGDMRLIMRLSRRNLLDCQAITLCEAAAQVGRLDVIQHTMDARPSARGLSRTSRWKPCDVDLLYRGAARGGLVDVMNAISTMCAGSKATAIAYWQALEWGHVNVLDWLAARQDEAVREWDRDGASPWMARAAPTSASLRWLHQRGVAIPGNLLACAVHTDSAPFNRDGLPGSADVIVYAVDVCGCQPPNKRALVNAARANRVDLLREAHRRGWLDGTNLLCKVWNASVKSGADDAASWLADHTHGTPVGWPSGVAVWPCLEHHFDTMVLSHHAGCPWHSDRFVWIPRAAHTIWSTAHGYVTDDMPTDRLLSACAAALLSVPSGPHKHPFDVPHAQPLTTMTRSEAAVVRARILVRTLARNIPALDVDAGNERNLVMLREGRYARHGSSDTLGLLPQRASSRHPVDSWQPVPQGCARRQRTRERRKRSLALRRREGWS